MSFVYRTQPVQRSYPFGRRSQTLGDIYRNLLKPFSAVRDISLLSRARKNGVKVA